jgi:hypothetical protein
MKSTKNDLKKKAIHFDSLAKEELHNACGSGYFYWDSSTKTLWYRPNN